MHEPFNRTVPGDRRPLRVVNVAGFSGSGKTTLIARLVARAKADGIRAGVFKHTGHPEAVPPDVPGKDTAQFADAGAAFRGLFGPGRALFYWDDQAAPARFIPLAQALDVDWLFIEGFKTASGPKIAVVRTMDDVRAAHTWPNVVAVVGPRSLIEVLRAQDDIRALGWRMFDRDALEALYRWIAEEGRFVIDGDGA